MRRVGRAVPRSDGAKGGRPAFDHVLMFKVLLLQAMHALSDERAEYLVKDRLSFMRFLGLGLADPVPDANTVWVFREALKRAGAVEALFGGRFDATLREAGYLTGTKPDTAAASISLRQVQSCPVLTPYRSATACTTAPGCRVSRTIRSLSSSGQVRRRTGRT